MHDCLNLYLHKNHKTSAQTLTMYLLRFLKCSTATTPKALRSIVQYYRLCNGIQSTRQYNNREISSSASSSPSGATTSLFESFGLLNYFLPFNPVLDAFSPIIYLHNS